MGSPMVMNSFNLRMFRTVLAASAPLPGALQTGDVGTILQAATPLGQTAGQVAQALMGQRSNALIAANREYADDVTEHLSSCCLGIVSSVNLMYEAVEFRGDGNATVDLDLFNAAVADLAQYVDSLGDAC
jgi:hypothetical protein